MSEYSREEFRKVDRDPDLMCEILKRVDDHGGTMTADQLEVDGYRRVEIDKQLKHLTEEGYLKGASKNVHGFPAALSPGPEVLDGIEELCSDPVGESLSWLGERLKTGLGKAIEKGVWVTLGIILHWFYTYFF